MKVENVFYNFRGSKGGSAKAPGKNPPRDGCLLNKIPGGELHSCQVLLITQKHSIPSITLISPAAAQLPLAVECNDKQPPSNAPDFSPPELSSSRPGRTAEPAHLTRRDPDSSSIRPPKRTRLTAKNAPTQSTHCFIFKRSGSLIRCLAHQYSKHFCER